MAHVLPGNLGEFRKEDKDSKDRPGEVLPDHETLNAQRVRNFLNQKAITAENFDHEFTLKFAQDLVGSKDAPAGEKKMAGILADAEKELDTYGLIKNFERELNDKGAAFEATLEKELESRNVPNRAKVQKELMHAYETYHTVREYCAKGLKIEKKSKEEREVQQTKVGGGIEKGAADFYQKTAEHFENMPGSHQAIAIGASILGAAWLLGGEKSAQVEEFKEGLYKVLKLIGAGIGLNYIVEIFTGKTGLTALEDWSKSTVNSESFWNKAFDLRDDQDKGKILRKSIAYFGDMDFLTLAKMYRSARDNGSHKVELATVGNNRMTQEQIYTALETYFREYPESEDKYRRAKPPLNWRDAITTSLIENGDLKLEDDVIDRTAAHVRSLASRGIDAAAGVVVPAAEKVGKAAHNAKEYLSKRYEKLFHKTGTAAEVEEWAKKELKFETTKHSDLEQKIRDQFPGSSNVAAGYIRAFNTTDPREQNIKHNLNHVDDGDYVYIMAHREVAKVPADQEERQEAVDQGKMAARNYLFEEYGKALDGKKVSNFVEYLPNRFFDEDDGTMKVFARMPRPGTVAFNKRTGSDKTSEEAEALSHHETFGETDKLEYDKFDANPQINQEKQRRFRLRFHIDSNQKNEQKKLLDFFTARYNTEGIPRKSFMDRLLTNDADRDEALRILEKDGFRCELNPQVGDLKGLESKIVEIEQDAKKKIKGTADTQKLFETTVEKDAGLSIRLALLHDSEAMKECHYEPGDPNNSKINDPGKLLDWYKKNLEARVETENKGK